MQVSEDPDDDGMSHGQGRDEIEAKLATVEDEKEAKRLKRCPLIPEPATVNLATEEHKKEVKHSVCAAWPPCLAWQESERLQSGGCGGSAPGHATRVALQYCRVRRCWTWLTQQLPALRSPPHACVHLTP